MCLRSWEPLMLLVLGVLQIVGQYRITQSVVSFLYQGSLNTFIYSNVFTRLLIQGVAFHTLWFGLWGWDGESTFSSSSWQHQNGSVSMKWNSWVDKKSPSLIGSQLFSVPCNSQPNCSLGQTRSNRCSRFHSELVVVDMASDKNTIKPSLSGLNIHVKYIHEFKDKYLIQWICLFNFFNYRVELIKSGPIMWKLPWSDSCCSWIGK